MIIQDIKLNDNVRQTLLDKKRVILNREYNRMPILSKRYKKGINPSVGVRDAGTNSGKVNAKSNITIN